MIAILARALRQPATQCLPQKALASEQGISCGDQQHDAPLARQFSEILLKEVVRHWAGLLGAQ